MQFHSLRQRLFRQRRFRQILFGSLILSVLISFIIVPIERNHTINTFGDGLWWTTQTITTVGYGDVVPVTPFGRFLGIVLQILGTVMFGTLIAIISSSMGRSQEEMYWSRVFDRLDSLDEKIDKLDRETKYLVRAEVETEEKSV